MEYKELEIWQQDSWDKDLWHGENGVLVNTSALKDREEFADVFISYAEEPFAANRQCY